MKTESQEQKDLKERLGRVWLQATDLPNADHSPLTQAIVNECMEATEPHYDLEDMADAMQSLADDCRDFAALLIEEAGR
jgi:hypothetical protein